VSLARSSIEEGTFADAWEAGRAMALDQAIAFAFEEEA
jgi:hypothetical protein